MRLARYAQLLRQRLLPGGKANSQTSRRLLTHRRSGADKYLCSGFGVAEPSLKSRHVTWERRVHEIPTDRREGADFQHEGKRRFKLRKY